jgi:CheY-like chemotaxis protein
MSEGEKQIGGRVPGVLAGSVSGSTERESDDPGCGASIAGEDGAAGSEAAGSEAVPIDTVPIDAVPIERAGSDAEASRAAMTETGAHWLADGVLDVDSTPAPSVVIVDADASVRATLLEHLAPACAAHEAEPAAAVALLEELASVDIALVDCDPPPSQQAPIFRALARWPGAVCVLMSQNHQKVEQLRALGMFAPLVLDKPLQPEALDAIRAAVLEIAGAGLA